MKNIFELVYLIYENKLNTQREFAEAMFISLGNVNNLIKEAKEMELIEGTKNYEITKEGMLFLENHNVDNAIIMAAGFGSRFVPMTYEKPKGLLEVHGEVMIERQIKQLHEVGIYDISIVVGYLKEKFEYLTDKYGVKLIYNPDYSVKNNISSLYYAKEEMKNTYVLTSDIYMPNNLYQKYEYDSFYAIEFFENYTDEWAVKLNKNNLILEVDRSGGENTWAINGPVFLTEEFSKRLISLIENIYDDKSKSQWYWEDVYVNNMDKFKLYGKKFQTNSILEFESLEELRQYDESYLIHSRSDILEVIQDVFKVELSDIVGISTLKEGMTNDSFLFEINDNKYVFRNPGIGTDLLINREEEAIVYNIIKDLNISDEIVYLNPSKGYKITKFVEKSRVIDISNDEEVKLALEKLRLLHESNLFVDHEFDINERIHFYLDLCKKSNAILFKDFENVYNNILLVIEFVQGLNRSKRLCHVDSVPDNFLISDNNMHLLDWEYAGMADPLMDLAMYVVYGGLQDNEILHFIDLYFEREHTDEERLIVFSYIALAGFLWSLWTQYKQAEGEDFGTYGMDQYQYARKYSRIVLEEINHA